MLTHPLTMAICNDPVVMPLKSGAIDPGRLKLSQIEVVPITTAMRQMVRGLAFDVCEMAYVTYLSARACGKPLTALPIVVTRNFHHRAAFTTEASGIKTPKDLEGRRVAVSRGFTNTTGAWVRGILGSRGSSMRPSFVLATLTTRNSVVARLIHGKTRDQLKSSAHWVSRHFLRVLNPIARASKPLPHKRMNSESSTSQCVSTNFLHRSNEQPDA